MTRTRIFLCALALAISASAPTGRAAEPELAPYKQIKIIDLPGAEGGNGGAMAFDADTGTVWLAQSPDRNVVVIETKGNSVNRVIDGVERPRGIAFDPHLAFVADADAAKLIVLDKRSFEKVATLDRVGAHPEAIYVESDHGTVWVAATDGELTAFEPAGEHGFKRVASLELNTAHGKAPLGTGLYVAERQRIYQPVAGGIVAIDPALRTVDYRIRLDRVGRIGCLAYDAKSGRLIAGTDRHRLLFIKAATGTLIGVLRLKGEIGALAVDPGMGRLYAADGAGTVDVIDLAHVTLLATLPTETGVHALALDPGSHLVYVYRGHANKVDVLAPQ